MGIQLVTFGGLQVTDGERELERVLSQRSRAALFVYLTIERNVAREALTAIFWPESDAASSRHALRQSLYHLRTAMGARHWLTSRPYELRVSDEITADATMFSEAVERGDTERAFRLYRGPFLNGVHLVDLQGWESWVDGRRARFARLFRKTCRELLAVKRRVDDHVGALDIVERWTALDPTDDEAQHQLITALAAAGERAEAIRQYEAYCRLLAPEGLEPLDETRALVEQLRGRRQGWLAGRNYRRQFSAFTVLATHSPSARPLRLPD